MDLMPSSDQEAIQASVRSFLEHELPMERVRRLSDAGADAFAALWRGAGELGFFGLGIASDRGGAGYGLTEEMVLFEELGRALAPGPWLGSVLAAHALVSAGEGAAADLRARILAGEVRVALVDGLDRPWASALRGGKLTGARSFVCDALAGDGFLVVDGGGVALVAPGADGVRVARRASMDPTRSVAHVDFEAAPCVALAADPAQLRREATVLACAEAVGGVHRTVELSVEYAKVRTQFDRPIGSFQAVKHRCADMAVRAEVARSATTYATVSVRDRAPDADFQASVAKVLCGNAYLQNAADNVQNHGGMGFTWECDAHLYVKRARSFDVTLGTRMERLDRLVVGLRVGAAPGSAPSA
ncbi:MAG TPA: acyl-CoA dehydrogenase family protein [Candidatus Binatia bacterium]|nr:acyl-CoA dehydrogenase family protein [Candidatus Binatia bacterium]